MLVYCSWLCDIVTASVEVHYSKIARLWIWLKMAKYL